MMLIFLCLVAVAIDRLSTFFFSGWSGGKRCSELYKELAEV